MISSPPLSLPPTIPLCVRGSSCEQHRVHSLVLRGLSFPRPGWGYLPAVDPLAFRLWPQEQAWRAEIIAPLPGRMHGWGTCGGGSPPLLGATSGSDVGCSPEATWIWQCPGQPRSWAHRAPQATWLRNLKRTGELWGNSGLSQMGGRAVNRNLLPRSTL